MNFRYGGRRGQRDADRERAMTGLTDAVLRGVQVMRKYGVKVQLNRQQRREAAALKAKAERRERVKKQFAAERRGRKAMLARAKRPGGPQ